MQDFAGRVAVVTGGGSGIGAAMARAFAREGMRIVLADVDESAMERVAGGLGVETLCCRTDVSRLDSVRELAERAFSRFGAVHVVCNNAGVVVNGPMESLTHNDWVWTINVNLWGVIHGVEAFVPRLVAQGQGGHIVNTASMAGLVPMQGMGAYVTSKYAVVGLSETLQRDLSGYGIGVSVLCPMVVDTEIFRAERNRPAELRNPGREPPLAEGGLDPGAIVGGILPPDEVAARVVTGIRENALYILTHTASREIIRRRFARIDRAAARV